MFLHLSVILFTEGVSATHTHTQEDTTPTPQADTPPDRHLPAQCMLGYGQQAGGTHPTGMQSCYYYFLSISSAF